MMGRKKWADRRLQTSEANFQPLSPSLERASKWGSPRYPPRSRSPPPGDKGHFRAEMSGGCSEGFHLPSIHTSVEKFLRSGAAIFPVGRRIRCMVFFSYRCADYLHHSSRKEICEHKSINCSDCIFPWFLKKISFIYFYFFIFHCYLKNKSPRAHAHTRHVSNSIIGCKMFLWSHGSHVGHTNAELISFQCCR